MDSNGVDRRLSRFCAVFTLRFKRKYTLTGQNALPYTLPGPAARIDRRGEDNRSVGGADKADAAGPKRAVQKRRMKRYWILLVAVALLAGCARAELNHRLRPGMSVEQVKALVGPQDEYRTIGDYEVYSYYNKVGSAWHRVDYHCIFKDGRIVEHGAGEIRHNRKTGDVFIMPSQ